MFHNKFLLRIAFVALCLLITPIFAFAVDAKLEDFGAVVDDGQDDTAAIQAAVDAVLKSGGGTIFFPSGKLEVRSRVTLIPNGYIGGEIKFQGNRGSIVESSVPIWDLAFYAGNLTTWTLEGLTFTGKQVPIGDPKFYDGRFIVFSNQVNQTNIVRCQFYGIAVPDGGAIVYIGRTDGRITDSQFDGNVGQYPSGSVILAGADTMGMTVSRSTFLDYANFRGTYMSKSPAYTGSWIRVNGGLPLNAIGQRRFNIEDSRFDEGAAAAINMENITWARISGINVNVNGATPGRGIQLTNVEHAAIEQSWFGYSANQRPAIAANNVGALDVNSLRLSGGVYFLERKGGGSLDVRNCPQCVLTRPKK